MMFPLRDGPCLLFCFDITVTFVIMHSFSMGWHCTDIFLAYRSIFCNDIYLLEVCTDEAVQLQKEAFWERSVAEESLRLLYVVVLYEIQWVYWENHTIFSSSEIRFCFQLTKYAQLFMDSCFFVFLFLRALLKCQLSTVLTVSHFMSWM